MADVFHAKRAFGKTGLFKGKQGEEKIDVFLHEGNPFFAPGPDGWADEVDDFPPVPFFAKRAVESQIESGVIDREENFGVEGKDLIAKEEEVAEEFGKGGYHIEKPHHLEIFHGKEGGDGECAHFGARDRLNVEAWIEKEEVGEELVAEEIGARLCGKDKKIGHFFPMISAIQAAPALNTSREVPWPMWPIEGLMMNSTSDLLSAFPTTSIANSKLARVLTRVSLLPM